MELENYTDEQLAAELQRRQITATAKEVARPTRLETPNFSALIEACEEQIESYATDDYDDDSDHYIYEAAMEAVYGQDVWKWINSRIR